jgi:tetratricopeptide (TPR) repeat protein
MNSISLYVLTLLPSSLWIIVNRRTKFVILLLLVLQDEIEGLRVQLDEDDGLYDTSSVEILMEGTQARNEQEAFQLQLSKECFDKGMDNWTDGKLDCALRDFSSSLEIREDICGRKDIETARNYLWKGTIHFLQEDYERALDDFYRCFRIQYEIKGSKDGCHMVINWINKAVDALDLKQTKALIWKKFMNCIELEQHGDSLKLNEDYDFAIQSYYSALHLEYMRRQLSPRTPGRSLSDCGDLHFKIGRCYQMANNWSRAMMEYREAFSIYLTNFGPCHRHTVLTSGRIVEVLLEMGFAESVVEAFVLDIPQAVRYEEAGDWKMSTNKDLKGALEDYEAALKIEGQYIGKIQVGSAILQYKIAKIHVEKKDISQALYSACRAVGALEDILGPEHELTASAVRLIKSVSQDILF